MAINNNPIFKPGQKLTPEQLKQMLALRNDPQFVSEGDAGPVMTSRGGSVPGKFGPGIAFVPAQVTRGTGVGADAEFMADPSGAGRWLISQPRNTSTWGNNDTTDVWDEQGNYVGTSTGQTAARGLATVLASAAGGAYANGGFGTGSLSGGGLSGLDAAMVDVANSGSLQAGNFATTGGSLSGLDMAALDAGAGATNVVDGLAGLDAAALDAGAGATNVGTDLSGLDAAALDAGAGPTNVGTPTTTPPPPGTTAAETAATKLATDAGTKAATDAGLKLLTAGGAAIIGGDALSDPVDTSRYDKLFENMLSEQALASQRGKDLWADYTSIWRPAQIKFADTAMNFDTPARREQAAQAASAGLASTYDQQRQTTYRDMMAAGLDPSTIQALGASSRIVQAKDDANAQNTARNDVEKTGLNLLKGVVDQGNTIQNQATQQSNVATNTTGAASNLLTQQGNVQNQNTQNRNAMIGDLFTGLSSLYGMSQTKTGT